MPALMELMRITYAGVTTDESDAACRSWLASARHPRFGRPYSALVYQPTVDRDRHGRGLVSRPPARRLVQPARALDYGQAWRNHP